MISVHELYIISCVYVYVCMCARAQRTLPCIISSGIHYTQLLTLLWIKVV